MKHFVVQLADSSGQGLFWSGMAEDEHHAETLAESEFPDCMAVHISGGQHVV